MQINFHEPWFSFAQFKIIRYLTYWRHWVFIKVTGARVETKVITYSLHSRVSHLAAKTPTTTPNWRLNCSQVRANGRCIALKQIPALFGVTCCEFQGVAGRGLKLVKSYCFLPTPNNFISFVIIISHSLQAAQTNP